MVSAILLAAGKGKRFGSTVSKPLVKIKDKPVIIYSLLVLSAEQAIDEIIIVANKHNQSQIARAIKQYGIKKIKCIIKGGLRRQDSVKNGLKLLDQRNKLVLIHDSARPFIDSDLLKKVIDRAKKTKAAILGVPVKATIKSVNSKFFVDKTLLRSKLWEVQTPQVFSRDLILDAFRRFGDKSVTDDSALVEKIGAKVSVVMGSYDNIKITTPGDLLIAGAFTRV